MPRYDARRIEAKWQAFWDEHGTFVTTNDPPAGSQGKLYVLDMFPYPSGSGLHVGHPEGQTATDIVCRYERMKGKHVLHPMGWDAFGLPAEQYAIETGTHPRVTTYANIDTFRRQEKMLGFSYDWSREFSTTDPDYYRWTQWIFLQLYDTWYDPDFEWASPDGAKRIGKGRPISELPIPDDVQSGGEEAVRRYQDAHRLAYQSEAPVNWCPALGTVLANEEVTADGKSDRGDHPVERRNLRQWMLRITAYAERLLTELDELDWTESIKLLQRNWIGKSVGAEVDFLIPDAHGLQPVGFDEWKTQRATSGYPTHPEENVLRVYTTRPDTLYGATYMVVAPEHPIVDRITTDEQREAVESYRKTASHKSDLDRTDLAKEKTGVFTGASAVNPANGERIPIWIADYVLISYGTGAIMAVPAHDERDIEFAKEFDLAIRRVVRQFNTSSEVFERFVDEHFASQSAYSAVEVPLGEKFQTVEELKLHCKAKAGQFKDCVEIQGSTDVALIRLCEPFQATDALDLGPHRQVPLNEVDAREGTAINSGEYDGLTTAEFKQKITDDLAACGLARSATNYRLRDWLFSRQRYWGEPFPIWHELDADGKPTGLTRAVPVDELPVSLPEMEDFKPKGTPDPPLSWAPDEWLYATAADGTRLKRETNSMPQWAGSCWYYLRFCDNKNSEAFIDPAVEKYWLPVDLYIGGAEHAVLHLLYSRFWHKVLFDRGHVSTPEPFRKLVNQGMILGEPVCELIELMSPDGDPLGIYMSEDEYERGPADVAKGGGNVGVLPDGTEYLKDQCFHRRISKSEIIWKQGIPFAERAGALYRLTMHAEKMSKSKGNVINPDDVVSQYGADALRLYEMFMGPLEQVKPWSMSGVEGVSRFLGRVWRMIVDERADDVILNPAVQEVALSDEQERVLHRTIKVVTEDIEKLSCNTAISRMMEFTNVFTQFDARPHSAMERLVLLLSPFAPHIAEELWQVLGHKETLAYEPWPEYDESKLAESEIEVPVQVNGKLRAKIRVPVDAKPQAMQEIAEASEDVQKQIAGKQVVKVIAVPGRMVNFVVKG